VTEPLDLAFLGRLRSVVEQATAAFERFEYAIALQATEDAFWSFCDDYLELVKTRSYAEEDTQGRRSAIATLQLAMSTFLRLLAPFLPYVTEEVWSWRLAGEGRSRSIHTSPWPSLDELTVRSSGGETTEAIFVAASQVLGRIRGAKSEAKKSLRWPVTSLEIAASKEDLVALDVVLSDVLRAGAAEGAEVRRREQTNGERFQVVVTLGEQAEA
jgi:valyl-tRNA synthetase